MDRPLLRLRRGVPALAVLALAVGGCGRSLRGIEGADQVLLHGGKVVLQQTEAAEAAVTPTRVPWGDKSEPVGFLIEVTNLSEQPLHLVVNDIELIDQFGRALRPVDPEQLMRAFGAGAGDRTNVQTVAYRRIHVRRPRHHYAHYSTCYRPHPAYYGWATCSMGPWFGGGPYYDSSYDAYAAQRATAKFLSELLTDQIIDPGHTIRGRVVFTHRLADDEELTLNINLQSIQPAGETEPQPPGDQPPVTTLTFRFEVD